MTSVRSWLLPTLLVVNGLLSVAIADRAATLRRSWQAWEVRLEAQTRLKHIRNPLKHPGQTQSQAEP